jgi:hypothetical protein
MKPISNIQLRVSLRERELIAEYGYPFEELEAQLEEFTGVDKTKSLMIGTFYLDQLLGNLSISIRESDDMELQEAIDALCTDLEIQSAQQGYRA